MAALCIDGFERAAQGISGIAGLDIEQLAMAVGESDTGKTGPAAGGKAKPRGFFGVVVRHRLRTGDAEIATDQLGGAGEHATLDARGQRSDDTEGHYREHQRGCKGAQFWQMPFTAQAA